MYRRQEIKTKLYHPKLDKVDNFIRDNLSDLRSMVSREFGALIMGSEDLKVFHHLANRHGSSLSGRDQRLAHKFIKICLRIIWLALQRPNIALLEMEINHLTCTESFNKFVHHGRKVEKLCTTPLEDKVLRGIADVKEPKLLQRSHLGKELLIGKHDHRMLAIGIVNFPPRDERIDFLDLVFSGPEEIFEEHGIDLGVLGKRRSQFDEMLAKKVVKKKSRLDSEIRSDDGEKSHKANKEEEKGYKFSFNIPEVVFHDDTLIPDTFPLERPKYIQTETRNLLIKHQCEMWKRVVEIAQLGLPQLTVSWTST